jgi:RHS repeat-associated protein
MMQINNKLLLAVQIDNASTKGLVMDTLRIKKMNKKLFCKTLCAFSLALSVSIAAPVFAQQSTAYTYNPQGLVLSQDGPRTDVTDVTTYTYDTAGNRTSMTNALVHITQLLDYNGRGQPTRVIDANGTETLLSYHVRGWLSSVTVVDPSGDLSLNSVTNYTYDNVGQLINITLPNSVELNYTYDGSRRLTGISNNLGESIAYSLDNAGNRTAETILNSGGGISYSVTRAFDELSRVMDVIVAENQTTHVDYDVNGNATTVTDPRTNVTNQTYDPLDRLEQTADPAGGTTNFGYDDQDRLTSVTDANGNTTTYTYDAFDNVTEVTSPDTGTATYTYDNANNRTGMIDSRGVVVAYRYDALNRLTSVTYSSAPEENVTYQYDQTANGNRGIGRLTDITDQSGSTAYQYDHRGNLLSKSVSLNGQSYTTAYQYDLGNNPTAITYPSELIVRYAYDSLGRTQIVTTEQPGELPQTIANNATYLPFGSTTSLTYGNGLHKTLAYDQDYRLTGLSTGSVVDMSYRYDANGNITQIDHLNQPANDQLFGYDVLDRLNNSSGDYGILDFSYDPLGNRLSRNQTQGSDTKNESYNYFLDSNQLNDIDRNTTIDSISTNSQRSFSYDYNGNPTAIVNSDADAIDLNSTYNASNRLSQITTATAVVDYIYNALGQRTQKSVTPNNPNDTTTTTAYVYNEAGQLLSEITAGQITRDYFYMNGQAIATLVTTIGEAANDEFYITNKQTGLKLRPTDESDGSAIIATSTGDASNWTRYRQVNRPDGYFYLQNVQTGKYFRPMSKVNGSGLEQRPTSYAGKRTQWSLNTADSEHQYLVNRWSGKHIRPDKNIVDGPVVLRPKGWRGNWTRWKLEQVITETATTAVMYYYHNDHLGTPRALTDQSQNIVWQASYTPFGEAAITTQIVENNIRFPGQYFDQETNLHYNYFRYYDPSTGRYLRSDPIGLLYDFSDPQLSLSVELSLVSVSATPINNILNHTYAYVDNNPAIKSDPSGLFSTGFNANWLNTPPTPSQFMAPQPPSPKSSCETRCFKKFAKSVYSSSLAIGAGGILAGGSGVASLIKHHANSASTISDIFGISSCLHRCKDDDCKK